MPFPGPPALLKQMPHRFATDDRDIPFDSYPISAKGGFYGPKAAELGGVFTDNRFAIGSFAAKQDASE